MVRSARWYFDADTIGLAVLRVPVPMSRGPGTMASVRRVGVT
jgi:hypothetical protein